jgi:hypothetical protein
MNKYIGKYRIILIETKNDTNDDYLKALDKLPKYKEEFDKLGTIIIPAYSNKFSISLYGMDGYIKYRSEQFTSWNVLIRLINNMEMQRYIIDFIKLDKNIGYDNKQMANYTLTLLKNELIQVKFLVITTLYNEAKYSRNKTLGMRDAIKIYKNWLNDYNSS